MTRNSAWEFSTTTKKALAARARRTALRSDTCTRESHSGAVRMTMEMSPAVISDPRMSKARAPPTPDPARMPCRVMTEGIPKLPAIMATHMTVMAMATTPYDSFPRSRVTMGTTATLARIGATVPKV
jgi:hypothetical protein